jgi:hypothetical protein
MAGTRSASRSASSFSARDRRDGSRDQPVVSKVERAAAIAACASARPAET